MNAENRLVKVGCPYCAGHLEFTSDAVGTVVSCPHCSKSITLSAGSATSAPPTIPPVGKQFPQPNREPSRTVTKLLFVVAAVFAFFFINWKAWKFFAYASVPPGGGWVQDPEAHSNAITLSALIATVIIFFCICLGVIVFYKAWQIIKGWLSDN